eukprot:TRINITY_DN18117_c0_g1_i1.p1 TRINITY_DN18117_c0_g1~~TRINITY_DN18117_c0_g1_i1.p1  ORF type:complete len:212 (-),score=31.59 TRINITY_DN18117_c0_g1_i1:408-1043(-)
MGCNIAKVQYAEVFFVVRMFYPSCLLLKALRRFEKICLVLHAFSAASDALPVILYSLFLIACVFTALIFLCEPRENVDTIGSAFWLTLMTMSSIGYADVYPTSDSCKAVIGALIVVSQLYIAIPIGIVGNAFRQTWEDREHLLLMKRTRDRIIRAGYSPTEMWQMFAEADMDRDGALSLDECLQRMLAMEVVVPSLLASDIHDALDWTTTA